MTTYSDQFENFGERRASEVSALLREWADFHEDANYHEFVVPLYALAERVEQLTTPMQFFVMRAEDLFSQPLAEFYIVP